MKNLQNKIQEVIDNPPTKKVKCSCNGKSVYLYTEPDGPNASDWGNKIYGSCDRCDINDMVVVEDTAKKIKYIAELKISQK